MAPRWRIFGDFLCLVFAATRVQHVSYLHPRKEKRKKIEETTGQKHNVRTYYAGLP